MTTNEGNQWEKDLTEAIYKYIEKCDESKEYPNKAGFRKYLRIAHPNFLRNKIQFDTVVNAVKDLEDNGEDFLINAGLKNRINTVIAKLLLSANHGMSEKTNTDVTSGGKPLQTVLVDFINAKPNNNQHPE